MQTNKKTLEMATYIMTECREIIPTLICPTFLALICKLHDHGIYEIPPGISIFDSDLDEKKLSKLIKGWVV